MDDRTLLLSPQRSGRYELSVAKRRKSRPRPRADRAQTGRARPRNRKGGKGTGRHPGSRNAKAPEEGASDFATSPPGDWAWPFQDPGSLPARRRPIDFRDPRCGGAITDGARIAGYGALAQAALLRGN